MKFSGEIISEGITWGKAKFLKHQIQSENYQDGVDQTQLFLQAIESVTKELEEQIQNANAFYSERISGIFLTHKYIVNDPIILEQTKSYIESGMTAQIAFKLTVHNILIRFAKISNKYMLGRIIDILDATDKVKVVLKSIHKDIIDECVEDGILILKNLKPSIIFNAVQHNIKGFISSEGYFLQHSGIIAREIHIPGMICPDIFSNINEEDFIILDTSRKLIIINPDKETIIQYQREVNHEL